MIQKTKLLISFFYTSLTPATAYNKSPPFYLIIPTIFLILIVGLPILYLSIRTIEATNTAWEILFSFRSLQTLGRSILLMVTVTILSGVIALPLAWITARTNLPLRKVWTILATLPLVIPSFIGAYLFDSAFGPKGLIQNLLEQPFGIDKLPDIHGLFGATAVLTLLSYPYLFLTIRGSINNIDPSMEESSRSLGHSAFSTFIKITLPQLKPAIIAGSLLVSLYTLSDFGAVSLMRYNTFTWTIYQQYESVIDRTASATLSLALVSTAIIILLLEQNIRGKRNYHRIGSGTSRKIAIVQLGVWKYPSLFIIGSIISVALIIPIGILIFWLIRGLSNGEPMIFSLGITFSSLALSLITAIVTVLFSIAVSLILVRYPSRINKFLETISFTGYALPGVVVAISLVYFGANYALPLYQTNFLLVTAYIILFFPVALGSSTSSLLKIDPKLEECARNLKHNYFKVLIKITIPLMKSGLLMAASMVFLLTIKELPATLILGPIGFKTLATQVWTASSEAFFAQAAAPALCIILISILPLSIFISKDTRVNE